MASIDHDDGQVTEDDSDDKTQIREGEEGYVQDEDKARDMAEAGDTYRTAARAVREDTKGVNVGKYDWWLKDKNTPEERAEVFEKAADDAENSAGELHDESLSSDYSHNPEKAKLMILAERRRKSNLAEKTPREVGNQYDLKKAEVEVGKSLAEALKEAPGHKVEAVFLRYSHLIAERLRKDGDPLSLNLEALDLAYKFMGGWETLQEHGHNKWVQVKFNNRLDGSIDITKTNGPLGTTAEKWHIPMFDKIPFNSGGYDRSHKTDTAYYEVVETSKDSDGEFDKVEMKKTRKLGEADVASLKKVFGEVRAHDAVKRGNTLYPGDEGYEDALRDEHYGQDGTNGQSYLEQNYGIKP